MNKETCNYIIAQNGRSILSSNDSLMVIWNNLIGKNFRGEKHKEYIDWALRNGFDRGEIQYIEKGIIKDKFVIA